MEREIVLHDGNIQQSFTTLSLKPNGQIKTWVPSSKSHPIQQYLDMTRPVEFGDEAFGTQHSCQIYGDRHLADPHLHARRNPRTTSFIHVDPAVPTLPASSW
jgi:hypothetical protein